MYTETESRASAPHTNSTSSNPESLGQEAAEAFMESIFDRINAGAQAVMMSIGHRSGLFDVMATLPPADSQEIADKAGLAERYVREWLAVMVTAGIFDYDAGQKTYYLPPVHAACLTRGAQLGNAAVYAQFVSLMGLLQDQTLHCFESGSGTRYDDYPCFHQIMAEDSEQTVVASLFDILLPLAGDIEQRLDDGIDVLDAGCGKGLALIAMAESFPRSRFTGYDLCADAIGEAKRIADAKALNNVCFAIKDLTDFAEQQRYDFITSFDAVHDQKNPRDFIGRLHRALKPSGIYLMQDIGGSAKLENNLDFPMASLLYAVSCTHCTAVSLGQGGEGLGTMWGWETAQGMLEDTGYAVVKRHVLPHDPMNVWFISRKEDDNG